MLSRRNGRRWDCYCLVTSSWKTVDGVSSGGTGARDACFTAAGQKTRGIKPNGQASFAEAEEVALADIIRELLGIGLVGHQGVRRSGHDVHDGIPPGLTGECL